MIVSFVKKVMHVMIKWQIKWSRNDSLSMVFNAIVCAYAALDFDYETDIVIVTEVKKTKYKREHILSAEVLVVWITWIM